MNNNEPRRKGFSFLSFLLGILIGIILVIGTVAGVVYYVLSGKIDDVFNTVGMSNKDGEGNSVYINTDKDNGGVETLLELVTVLGGYISDTDNLSVGKVENLIPAVSGVVDGFHGMLNEYIEIDRSEFAEVPFSRLGEFVQDKILDIQPAKLLDGFGMGGALDNKIMSIIFNGSEAEYVTDEDTGATYPAYYDLYSVSDGKYLRTADNYSLPEGWENNLVPQNGSYRLYYCTVDGVNYVADKNLNLAANAVNPAARVANGVEYTPSASAKLSGHYYYENGNKVTVSPITLRSLSDGGFDALNEVYLTELLSSEGNDLAFKVLDKISLGDIMEGNVDFDEVLSNLTVPEFTDVKATDGIICYLGYGIYSVDAVNGTCKIEVADGEELDCTFTVDENGVIASLTVVGGEAVPGTPINEISGMISGLSNKLTIGELITNITAEDKVLYSLKGYTVNNLSDGINKLKISDIIDVKEDNLILNSIKDSTIEDLPDTISNITINTVYYKEIYKVTTDEHGNKYENEEDCTPAAMKVAVAEEADAVDKSKQIVFSEEYIYYKRSGDETNGYKYTIVQIEGVDTDGNKYGLGKLTQAQFDAEPAGTYYTYGKAQGIWEMLLYNKGTEKAYALENLTAMVENVSENMNHSLLRDLHNAGLLKFSSSSDLDKKVKYPKNGNEYTALGDLELTEALSFIASIAVVI